MTTAATRLPLIGLALMTCCAMALAFGTRTIGVPDIWAALTQYDHSNANHIVIRDIRLPRIVAAVLAGSALGAAGALMQGMTRNPLADPGLVGVNAGAAFAVLTATTFLGIQSPAAFIWPALIGGISAAVLVFALGGGSQAGPARLILAGAAVSALFLALGRGILLVSRKSLEVYRFWVLGGFDGIDFSTLTALLPFFLAGAVLAICAAWMLNSLMLGEDVARGLGLRVGLAKALALCAIVLLCAATVAMAGPIAFVGLIVPHLARATAGAHMVRLTLLSGLYGALLVAAAELLGRAPWLGGNMQAGVMIALIGGPVLVWFIHQNQRKL